MRTVIVQDDAGRPRVRALADQDSSMVSVMAAAEALLRRPPHATALAKGEPASVTVLDV